MTASLTAGTAASLAPAARQVRTIVWVMDLALVGLVGLVFDGYDLVVYGASASRPSCAIRRNAAS